MTTTQDLDALVSGRRFMVTGAAGFIGGHLVTALARRGAARVVALDREPLASGPLGGPAGARNVSQARLALGETAPEALDPFLRDVDVVFHLAAVKYRPDGEPLFDIVRSNVLGTAALLQASGRAGVSKIVFASSLYAYGRTRGEPFDEAEPARPTTVYGHSKLAAEQLLVLPGADGPRPACTALRYLFVYGPGQSPKHGYRSVIVKNFLRMLDGQRPQVHGDGCQVLDYVFVDDVVDATIRALAPSGDGRLYNVGSGRGVSIRELTALMREAADFVGDPELLPPDRTAGTSRVARIERIRDDLGWVPVTPLRTGLDRTLASIRQHRAWYERGGHASRA